MLDADGIEELVGQGVAVIVATAGDDSRPVLTRGWGPALGDRGSVLVGLEAPVGSEMRSKLRLGGVAAITLARPTSYVSVQFKGSVLAIRDPDRDDLDRADAHGAAFAAECERIGLPDALLLKGAVDVVMSITVEECYDQTPGLGAGKRV